MTKYEIAFQNQVRWTPRPVTAGSQTVSSAPCSKCWWPCCNWISHMWGWATHSTDRRWSSSNWRNFALPRRKPWRLHVRSTAGWPTNPSMRRWSCRIRRAREKSGSHPSASELWMKSGCWLPTRNGPIFRNQNASTSTPGCTCPKGQ